MANHNSIYCSSCRRYTFLTNKIQHPKDRYTYYTISECNNCNFFFLVERNTNGNIKNIYPNSLPRPINEKTPDFLKKDLEEAYMCFSVDAYRATSVMARRALQSCCIEKGAKKDKKLRDQIDWLLGEQIITKDLKKWAHEVRLTGNDSAHPPEDTEKDTPVSAEDAEDILTLLEQFIEVLYITPALAEERQKKRKNSKNH